MERLLNAVFSTARVHRPPLGATANRVRGNQTYAMGHEVYLRGPIFDFDSPNGNLLLVRQLSRVAETRGSTYRRL
jgi:hypothetical protein